MKTTINKLLILTLIAPSIAHASYSSSDYTTTSRYKRVWDKSAFCAGALFSGLAYGASYLASLSFDAFNRTPWTPARVIGHTETTKIYSPYYQTTTIRPLYSISPRECHFDTGVLFSMAAIGCGIAALANFCDSFKGKLVKDYSKQPIKRRKKQAHELVTA